jgi:hypothetical protein
LRSDFDIHCCARAIVANVGSGYRLRANGDSPFAAVASRAEATTLRLRPLMSFKRALDMTAVAVTLLKAEQVF